MKKKRIVRDIRKLFEYEKKNYYKPVAVGSSWSNNYIKYESIGERNTTLSVEQYVNKIKPYLKDIISNLKKYDTWKIPLTIAINFTFSKDNGKESVMHSQNDKIVIMINGKPNEVTFSIISF